MEEKKSTCGRNNILITREQLGQYNAKAIHKVQEKPRLLPSSILFDDLSVLIKRDESLK